jgi:hypothetical protein
LVLPASAKTVEIEKISTVAGLHLEASSSGRYNAIALVLRNTSGTSHSVAINLGAYFRASNTSYQNLAALESRTVRVAAGAEARVTLATACMDPARGVAPSQYTGWSATRDPGLGLLLKFLDTGAAMLRPFVNPEFFSTPEKRTNFKQAVVWVYYDASKDRMTSFASAHMFGGDRARAAKFIDAVYPAAKTTIQIYKKTQGG